MFHTVSAVDPRPMVSPMDCAIGPLTASMRATAAARIRATRVTRSIAGRSFQIGRPSSTSYIRFIARPKAPTYPDADHSAPARPRTRARPALGASTNCSTGPRSVSTADDGPSSSIICITASTVFSPWPKTPSSDTSARSAGKSESTE